MKKTFLVSILIGVTVFSCISLTGCKKAKTTTAPAKQEQVKKQDKEQKQVSQEDISKKIDAAKKFETKDQTACYRVYGEKNDKKTYYTMAMPQTKEVTKFIFNYLKTGDTIDYKTVKGDPKYELYSKNLQKKYGGKEHSDQEVINNYKEAELSQVFSGIEKYNYIEFNKDFTSCKISVNRLLIYNHFTKDSGLGKSGGKYNKMYTKEGKYTLVLEDGKWKVDDQKEASVIYPYEPELSE